MHIRYLKAKKLYGVWALNDEVPAVTPSDTLAEFIVDKHLYVPVSYIYNAYGDHYVEAKAAFTYLGLDTDLLRFDRLTVKQEDLYNFYQDDLLVHPTVEPVNMKDLLIATRNEVEKLLDQFRTVYKLSIPLSRVTVKNKGATSLKKGNEMVSANDNLHYRVKSEIIKHLRTIGLKYGQQLEVKYPFDEKTNCYVRIIVHPPSNRRMDPPNWYPTVKPIIDGMTDANIWTDDNSHVIKGMYFEQGSHSGLDRQYVLDFEIVEVL